MDNLPDEVLLNVLSWLPPDVLLKALGVCRRWRYLPGTPQGNALFVIDPQEFAGAPCEPDCVLHAVRERVYPGAVVRYAGNKLPMDLVNKMTRLVTYRMRALIPKAGTLNLPPSVQVFSIRHVYAYPPPQVKPTFRVTGKNLRAFEAFDGGEGTPAYACDTATRVALKYEGRDLWFDGFPRAEHVTVNTHLTVKQQHIRDVPAAKTILIRGADIKNVQTLLDRLPALEKVVVQPNHNNICTRMTFRRPSEKDGGTTV